jgi:hypothetical protein
VLALDALLQLRVNVERHLRVREVDDVGDPGEVAHTIASAGHCPQREALLFVCGREPKASHVTPTPVAPDAICCRVRRTANTTGSPRRERSDEQRAESERAGSQSAPFSNAWVAPVSIHAIQA